MASLGLLLGLGLLTKTTAIVLIPVAAVALFLKSDRKPLLNDILIGAGVLLVACLPWLIRNQSLYGDPLAIGAFQKASVGNLATSVAIERAGGAGAYWFSNVFPLAADSYWAVFGYFDIFFQPATYYAIHAAAFILLGAFVWAVVSKTVSRRVAIILLLLLAMVLAAFISYNSNYFQAQGRYLYPAVFAISGMLAIGLRRIARSERNTLIGSGTIAAGLICLNIYATMVLLPAAFELMQQCVSSTP
jgi:4-amino-4-deoxy-L-arabinose transferase-like glycosyltransferase